VKILSPGTLKNTGLAPVISITQVHQDCEADEAKATRQTPPRPPAPAIDKESRNGGTSDKRQSQNKPIGTA
jgi:hypothetical protein